MKVRARLAASGYLKIVDEYFVPEALLQRGGGLDCCLLVGWKI